MNVIEIMTKAVHTIHPDQSLKECADTLKKHRVNGLIVVEGEHVVGVVTKADIFKSILPTYSDIIDDERHIASFEYIEERAHRLYDMKVGDIMGTPVISVNHETSIVKAGSLMILRRVKQLPVMDNGKLSGIITLTDIIDYIAKGMK